MRRAILPLVALLALSACGRPFKVQTAPGFVELEGQDAWAYQYRATTPEGVVVAVKSIDVPPEKGDLEFWAKAVTLQLRDAQGYALLGAKDVASLDGTAGRQLRFARDEDGKPFDYRVTLYLAQGRLFLVEAGGAHAEFERFERSVAWSESSVKVRCGGFLAPVLSSHTCNRW